VGAEAGGREYVHIRQGQGKGRRRQVRDRDRPGRGRTKESIHVRCGAPTHAPKCTPERKEAFCFTQMTALSGPLSRCDNHCRYAHHQPVLVPAGMPNLTACVFQPSQQQSIHVSDFSSFCHDSSPPTTSTSNSHSQVTHANTTRPRAARMWRRLSRESLHSATRLCRGSPKRDEGKAIVRWAPATLLSDCMEPFLRASMARPRSRAGHTPTRHRASRSALVNLGWQASREDSPLVTCCFAVLLQDTSTRKTKSTSASGCIAARTSNIIHVCNILLQRTCC
jgi:hypothetical protein